MSSITTWLNRLPAPLLYVSFALAWTALTVGVDVVMRRRLGESTRASTGQTASTMLTVLATLYAILIAFVIVQGWSNLGDAQSQVGKEATALVEMFEDSHALPPTAARAIQSAERQYARSVLADDWSSMAHERKPDARTTAAFHHLFATVQAVRVEGRDEPAFYQEAVARLNDVAGARRARLDAARGTTPTPLYVLLIAGGVGVVLVAAVLDSRNRRAHLAIVSLVAVIIGLNLALVVSFDHPFSGSVHVTKEPIQEMLRTST